MLQRMVSQRLVCTVSRKEFERMGSDFLSVVKLIISDASFCIVDIGSIFIGHSFGKLLIDKILI